MINLFRQKTFNCLRNQLYNRHPILPFPTKFWAHCSLFSYYNKMQTEVAKLIMNASVHFRANCLVEVGLNLCNAWTCWGAAWRAAAAAEPWDPTQAAWEVRADAIAVWKIMA